jgi:anti-sigma regulatory factor (Ser/Thr protein kinase)
VAPLLPVRTMDDPVAETSTTLAVDPHSCAQARRFVEQVLGEWDAPMQLIGDACLVATELVSNAIGHATGPINLRLACSPRGFTVEVYDGSPVLPVVRPQDVRSERGRGLLLVSRISSEWGTREVGTTKAVWARLDLPTERG